MIALAACLVMAGCLSLALSQERNWKAVTGAGAVRRTQVVMRLAGVILLGTAFALSVSFEGPGFAVLLWAMQAAVASVVVAMMLGFRPGLLRPLARACAAFCASFQ